MGIDDLHPQRGCERMPYGKRIRAARKATGITQKQLAEKIGVAEITIQQYERGIRTPKVDTLQRIAAALETSIDSLLNGEETSERAQNLPEIVIEVRIILSIKEKIHKHKKRPHTPKPSKADV